MNWNWRHYLTLAEKLSQEEDEACQRSAVSRAYYALYNQAKEWFMSDASRRQLGLKNDERGHEKLWVEISRLGVEAKLIANNGQMLRMQRNKCDYDKTTGLNLREISPRSVTLAKNSIERLKNIDSQ